MIGGGRVLGVLGGMGPLASAHFMIRLTLLTPADREEDHVPTVLWSDPRVPGRPAALRGGPDPLPWLVHGIRGLEAAGCGAIAIPCNTAHGWFTGMQAATDRPILHIIDATAAELRRRGIPPGTIGLMSTQATMAMRLYQDRLGPLGWDCIVPSSAEMEDWVNPAIAAIKLNDVRSAYEPLAKVAVMLRDRGASSIVLGCTEIPLGLREGPMNALGITFIDTIDALALSSIAWARAGG